VRLTVGLAAAAVLAAGWLLKPAGPSRRPPDDVPAPILQEVVQQREADTVFRRMRGAAPRAARFAVHIEAPPPPMRAWSDWEPVPAARARGERYGVVIGAREVLGDAGDLDAGTTVRLTTGDGRTFDARVGTRFADRGLAILELSGDAALETPARATDLSAGTAVFAAARPPSGAAIVAPMFLAAVREDELVTTSALDRFRGVPVFTADGETIGIVTGEGGPARLLRFEAALRPPPPPEPAAPNPFGLSLSETAGPGDAGPLVTVTAVQPQGPAERAGVRSGDVLVQIGGEPVTGLAGAVSALERAEPGALVLRARRGTRVRTFRIVVAPAAS
jgi:S1-C subfamily serine protease